MCSGSGPPIHVFANATTWSTRTYEGINGCRSLPYNTLSLAFKNHFKTTQGCRVHYDCCQNKHLSVSRRACSLSAANVKKRHCLREGWVIREEGAGVYLRRAKKMPTQSNRSGVTKPLRRFQASEKVHSGKVQLLSETNSVHFATFVVGWTAANASRDPRVSVRGGSRKPFPDTRWSGQRKYAEGRFDK